MLQLQKAKPQTNIGVLLNDWPQRIPMEQLSVLELGKSQFLQFKREYPETHPLSSLLVPKLCFPPTLSSGLKP